MLKNKKKLILNIARIAILAVLGWYIIGNIQMKDSYTDIDGVEHVGPITWNDGDRFLTFKGTEISLDQVHYDHYTDKAGKVHYGEIVMTKDDDFFLFNGDPVFLKAINGKPVETDPYKQGFGTIIQNIDMGLLVLAFVLWFPVPMITVFRWKIMLKIQGVSISLWEVFKLTYVGMFFNNAVPGLTGGDVVKAYYIAKQTSKKTETVTTVILDRVIGLAGLITICAIALVFKLNDPVLREYAQFILSLIVVGALGVFVFFNDSLRNALGINKIKSMLPFQKVVHDIDRAILIYKNHIPMMGLLLLMSAGVHVGVALLHYLLGSAIGISSMTFADYLVIVPILETIMAIPIGPAGWGIGELAYTAMLPDLFGVRWGKALALSIITKVLQLLWSLLGGIFLLTGGHKVSPKELFHELEEAEQKMAEAEE